MADKFFYLKLGEGNCLAKYWLNPKGEHNLCKEEYEHAAAIYFGTITTEKITSLIDMHEDNEKGAKRQFRELTENRDFKAVKDFFTAGYNAGKTENGETKFITISRGIVYICEPEDGVSDTPEDKYDAYNDDLDELVKAEKNKAVAKKIEGMKVERKGQDGPKHIPKIRPVKNVKEYEVKDVPHVLASLSCNQYYSQGTCRKINDWGAIQAIKHCLKLQMDTPKNAHDLMSLLSPYELETLVFLILKNAGLFVPAWRGGTQKDIDIIARNSEHSTISLPPVTVESNKSVSFQVKRKTVEKHSKIANWTVALSGDDDKNKILDANNWLLKSIKSQPDTKKWFLESLKWVPNIEWLLENIKTL